MRTLHRPDAARIRRVGAWKISACAFVLCETHVGERCGRADDFGAPARGFGMPPHRDPEISPVMPRGARRHQDTTGIRRLLGTNAVQTMSGGAGIQQRDANDSDAEPVHGFQVWGVPPQSQRGRARATRPSRTGPRTSRTAFCPRSRRTVARAAP